MPAYNSARFICEAIDSVFAQDYPNTELIVVDDGSTDQTVEKIRRYGHRVQIITQANQGSAVARNAGLAAARGEYVAFLDSDDVWLPGKLSAQVNYLARNPDIGLVYSRWKVWEADADGVFWLTGNTLPTGETTSEPPLRLVSDGSGWLYNRLLFSSLLHTITVMARRSLIEKVGEFDPELKRGQDYDYWLRASRHSEIHQLDRVFALYRLHGEGCVRRWPQHNYERLVVEQALQRWGLTGPTGERSPPGRMRHRLADTSFSFGYHHFWEGDPAIALRAFAHAATNRPTRLMAWAYLVLSAAKVPLRHISDSSNQAMAR
jgi:glycosyltransferase involved in cell wall biosynthesis